MTARPAAATLPVPTMTLPARPATRLAAFLALLVCAAGLRASAAQAQVVVVLTRPPVGRLGVADLYRLQAISPVGPASVTFRGTLTERRAGLLYEVLTDRVDLRQGANALRVSDLEPVRVLTEPREARYRDALVRTGEPPAGDYEVCVYALDADSGTELGRDCYSQPIDPLSPPLLVAPAQGESVALPLVTFVWTPPVPVPRGRLGYSLRVVEMLTGQVPELAARSNPAVFETDRLVSTTLVYPTSARPLRPARYAWTVTALVDGAAVAQSEAGAFTVPASTVRSGTVAGGFTPPPTFPALPGPVLTAPVLTIPLDQRLVLGTCSASCDPLTDPAVTLAIAAGGPVPGQAAGGPVLSVPPGVGLTPGLGTFRITPEVIQGTRTRVMSAPIGAPGGAPFVVPPIRPGSVPPPRRP